jgi:signal transduction histidine kinase
VNVSLSEQGDLAVLTFSDQGIGIAEEDQKRIFERFERANVNSRVSGMGLGLYITRQIVEAHRGTIRVQSNGSKGSTFIVELPLR